MRPTGHETVAPNRPCRWRAASVALLLAMGPVSLLGCLETTLALRAYAPSPSELFYGANLHFIIAALAVCASRLLFWRLDDRRFAGAALGMVALAELGLTATYWILKAPWAPPLGQTSGKLFALATFGIALLCGALLIVWAHRAHGSRRLAQLTRGRLPILSAGLIAAWMLTNGLVIARNAPQTATSARQDAPPGAHPDVFLIMVDTLRQDHLSFFGYTRPTSPNIDRLLAESCVFATTYSPSNKTIPAIASIFTGLYPTSHGMTEPFEAVPQQLPMLAEHFLRQGYATGAFVANPIISVKNGFNRGFETFSPPGIPWWCHHGRTALEGLVRRYYLPRDASDGSTVNQAFLSWLDDHPNGPRFAYLHYMEPHSFYEPPERDYAAVAAGIPRGPKNPPMFHDYPGHADCIDWECLGKQPIVSDQDRQGLIANYDGEIHRVDALVGEILEELRARGLLETGHVVFMADHGEEFGDHGGWFHGHSIYEELTRTPLAYRHPGGWPGGRCIARPISILDLLHTLFALLETEAPPLHQGVPLPELLGADPPARATAVTSALPPELYACRLRDWKLIRRGDPADPDERLYHVGDDPRELTDLAAIQPDTLLVVRSYLDAAIRLRADIQPEKFNSRLDPETLEQLRSLGYIQ